MKNVSEISDKVMMNLHCEDIENCIWQIGCLLEKPNKDEIIKNISQIRNSLREIELWVESIK